LTPSKNDVGPARTATRSTPAKLNELAALIAQSWERHEANNKSNSNRQVASKQPLDFEASFSTAESNHMQVDLNSTSAPDHRKPQRSGTPAFASEKSYDRSTQRILRRLDALVVQAPERNQSTDGVSVISRSKRP
jgi:hypothetical protein